MHHTATTAPRTITSALARRGRTATLHALLCAAAGCAVGACSSAPKPIGGAATIQPLSSGVLPEPVAGDYTEATRPYYFGPSDRLSIDVFGVPQLARKVQVDASGRLSFPLIGTVQASGRTSTDLAAEMETRLAPYIKNPQVSVNLEETTTQLVTVDGQVLKPGMFPVSGRMTLMRAVAVAGGASEFARLDDVVVFRKAGGRSYAALYNLGAIRRGNYEDPDIYPNDIVIVGDSTQRRLFRDLLQVVPLLTAPLVVLLDKDN